MVEAPQAVRGREAATPGTTRRPRPPRRPARRPTLQETRPQVAWPPGSAVRGDRIRPIPRSRRLTAPNGRRTMGRRPHALPTTRRRPINHHRRLRRHRINRRLLHRRRPHLRRHHRHPISRRRRRLRSSPQWTHGLATATATRTTTTQGLPDRRGGADQVCLVADCDRLDQPLAAATSAPVTEKPARAQRGSNWPPAWSSSSVRARWPLTGSR